jgi:hypothetical protein
MNIKRETKMPYSIISDTIIVLNHELEKVAKPTSRWKRLCVAIIFIIGLVFFYQLATLKYINMDDAVGFPFILWIPVMVLFLLVISLDIRNMEKSEKLNKLHLIWFRNKIFPIIYPDFKYVFTGEEQEDSIGKDLAVKEIYAFYPDYAVQWYGCLVSDCMEVHEVCVYRDENKSHKPNFAGIAIFIEAGISEIEEKKLLKVAKSHSIDMTIRKGENYTILFAFDCGLDIPMFSDVELYRFRSIEETELEKNVSFIMAIKDAVEQG